MSKPTKWPVHPTKTQISPGIRPVWSESSLSAWRKLGSLATHWVHSKDSDQTRRMPRLIRVFAGRTVILLVLSCRASFMLSELFCPCKPNKSISVYHNNPKFSDSLGNQCRPTEKQSDQGLHCLVFRLHLLHIKFNGKAMFSTLRIITAIFRVSEFLGFLRYLIYSFSFWSMFNKKFLY